MFGMASSFFKMHFRRVLLVCCIVVFSLFSIPGCGMDIKNDSYVNNGETNDREQTLAEDIPQQERTEAAWIVYGARQEVEREVEYDMSYYDIDYPGGDPPEDRGACTDVVVRALRYAGIDLQRRLHEDISENFDLYPDNWGLAVPDPNIDHRRVPNQMVYFERHAKEMPPGEAEGQEAYSPGDIIVWDLPAGRKHVGIVSDRTSRDGIPLILHNISGAAEENLLKEWEIIGHYRYPKPD